LIGLIKAEEIAETSSCHIVLLAVYDGVAVEYMSTVCVCTAVLFYKHTYMHTYIHTHIKTKICEALNFFVTMVPVLVIHLQFVAECHTVRFCLGSVIK
jgi:hypothetical protein